MVYVKFEVECLKSGEYSSANFVDFQLLTFNIQLCEAETYTETAEVQC